MNVAPNVDASISELNKTTPKRPRRKPTADVKTERITSKLEIDSFLDKINEHNSNETVFWKIQAVFDVGNKYHVLVSHKDLNENQTDVFEDERIEESAMRGHKIPSVADHWKLLYKRELKIIQSIFTVNSWISEFEPDKNRERKLIWGIVSTQNVQCDNDSQIFFLQRSIKHKPRGHTKK